MTARRTSLPLCLALAGLLAAGAASAQLKAPGAGSGTGLGGSRSAPAPSTEAAAPAASTSPSSAPGTAEMEKAAQLAAMGWLLLLDRKDWGTAWDTSAAMFRGAVPLPAWMDGAPKARAPLGKLVERKPADAVYKRQLQGRPDGDYVTLIFNSSFEQKPDTQEIVTTVREADGKWRVTGYSTR
jgi:hypothetical protein